MDRWEEFSRLRDDDPYHAWMMHRRLSEEALSGRSADPAPICPMIIKAAREGTPDKPTTIKELRESLIKIRDLLGGGTLFASPFDKAHLDQSLKALEGMEGNLDPSHDYFRYYLVYAYENALFPQPEGEWANIFSIRYIGAGISDIVRNDRAIQEPGAVQPSYDCALTVIDDSFAFLNEEFVIRGVAGDGTKTHSWRFDEIWFQKFEPKPNDFNFNGYRLGPAHVSEALEKNGGKTDFELYQAAFQTNDGRSFTPLDLTSPNHQPLADPASHGTHVTSRALRVFEESKDGRVDLQLTAVALPVEVTENTSGSTLGSYLLAGIRQAMMWNDAHYQGQEHDARQTPLVINFSYGFVAGMKDGTSKLNRIIAAMVDARNGFMDHRPTALVVPMGNSYDTRGVAGAKLDAKGTALELDWVVLPDDGTSSFVEIFVESDGDTDLSIELIAPDKSIAPLKVETGKKGDPNTYKTMVLKREPKPGEDCKKYRHAAEWGEWPPEDGSKWDRRIFIAIGPTQTFDPVVGDVPPGRWKLIIRNQSGEAMDLMAMVQRDDTPGSYPRRGRQSYFDHPDAWAEGGANIDPELFPNSGEYSSLGEPLTHDLTGSSFAAIDSNHVFTVGAGQGAFGDGIDPKTGQEDPPRVEKEAAYASKGPRRRAATPDCAGPDYSGLSDRSDAFPGVYAAGTYSHTEVALSGSSVAVPEFSGLCAARPQIIVKGQEYFALSSSQNPIGLKRPDKRFGLIKQGVR